MRLKFYSGLIIFVLLPFFAFADETLTITTYYPSPYGSYNQLTTASTTYLAYSSGNVGIGTTSPSAKLQVLLNGGNGANGLSDYGIATTASSGQATLGAEYIGDGYANLDLGQNQSGARRFWHISSRTSGAGTPYSLEIYNYNVSGFAGPLFTITPGGYVGIGTASPRATGAGLDAAGTLSVTNSANIGATDFTAAGWTTAGGGVIGWNKTNGSGEMSLISVSGGGSDGGFSFYDRNTQLVRILKNGYVGIGTAAPSEKLHVDAGRIGQRSAGTYGDAWGQWIAIGDKDYTSYPLYLGSSRYGMGVIWDSDGVFLGLTNNGSNRKDATIAWGDDADDSLLFLFNGSEKMRLTGAGNVVIGTTSTSYKFQVYIDASNEGHVDSTGAWQRSSDIRVKKNVSDLQDGLAKIMKLRAVRYDSKTDLKAKGPGKHLGFIGQEMEKVIPELVSTDNRGYKSIAYGDLTIVLTKAVQEQQKEIEDLKSEIQKLKAELHTRS
jgi:hypothetical protein